MNINIEDYLTDLEMKDIARDAFRESCLATYRKDSDRILGNVAHRMVWEEVNKVMDGKLEETIVAKVKGIVTTLSSYSVFNRKGVYEKEDSVGQQMLDAAVRTQKVRIENRVIKMAEGITKEDVIDLMVDGDFSFKLVRSN